MAASRSAAFIWPCTRPTFSAQRLAQHRGAFLGGGQVDLFGFLHQRADPIGALAAVQRGAQMGDQFVQPRRAHHPRLHRLAAGRAAGDARDIHVAIGGQRQGAGDRRRRHHQHIGGLAALALQLHALMHAEAVLLVHHRQAQIAEGRHLPKTGHGCRSGCRSRRPPAPSASRRGRRLSPARSAPPAARRPPWHKAPARPDAGAPEFRSAPSARPASPLPPHSASPAARRWSCPSRHRPAAAAACACRTPCPVRSRPAPASCAIGEGEGQGGDGLGVQLRRAGDGAALRARADWRGSAVSASWLASNSS